MDTHAAMNTFAKVVESGSFAAAAEALGLARSVVSRHISYLEQRYDVRLLNRTTRKLSLTDAGRAFHERIQPILAEVAELDIFLTEESGRPRGTLRMTAPVSFGAISIGPVILEFARNHPEVLIDLDLSDRTVDLVEEGYDLALRIGVADDPSLIAQPMPPQAVHICAAPAYLARHGAPATPDDLQHLPCLQYGGGANTRQWTFANAGRSWDAKINARLRTNNGDVVRAAARDGLGIARLPAFLVADDLRTGKLERVLADYAIPPLALTALYPLQRRVSPKVMRFIDFLGAHLARTAREG